MFTKNGSLVFLGKSYVKINLFTSITNFISTAASDVEIILRVSKMIRKLVVYLLSYILCAHNSQIKFYDTPAFNILIMFSIHIHKLVVYNSKYIFLWKENC